MDNVRMKTFLIPHFALQTIGTTDNEAFHTELRLRSARCTQQHFPFASAWSHARANSFRQRRAGQIRTRVLARLLLYAEARRRWYRAAWCIFRGEGSAVGTSSSRQGCSQGAPLEGRSGISHEENKGRKAHKMDLEACPTPYGQAVALMSET